jgi:hypothetical protein
MMKLWNSGGYMKAPEEGDPERAEAEKEGPPPVLKSWNRLYALVIVYTLALVLALYIMTITLNR